MNRPGPRGGFQRLLAFEGMGSVSGPHSRLGTQGSQVVAYPVGKTFLAHLPYSQTRKFQLVPGSGGEEVLDGAAYRVHRIMTPGGVDFG